MTEFVMPDIKTVKDQLRKAFGTYEVGKTDDGRIYASAPGAVQYGRQTEYMSRGGATQNDALKKLYKQVCDNARSSSERNMVDSSEVFRGKDSRAIYTYLKADGTAGLYVSND